MDPVALANAIEKALSNSPFFQNLNNTLNNIDQALPKLQPGGGGQNQGSIDPQNAQGGNQPLPGEQNAGNVTPDAAAAREAAEAASRDLQGQEDYALKLQTVLNDTVEAGGAVLKMYENVDNAVTKLTDSTADMYADIYKSFGGLDDLSNIANETTKSVVDKTEAMNAAWLGNLELLDSSLKTTIPGTEQQIDILARVFESSEDMARANATLMTNFHERNMLKINEMGEADYLRLMTYGEGLGIEQRKIAELMQETIRRTGSASNDMLDEISAYSKAVADATGQDYKLIADGIADIVLDVKTFGDIQVEEAARIVSSLNQMGVSYQSFGSMVNKFMSFESAASAVSDLTSVFGVHLDTMELMQLANEDEEAFLHRIRDSFDEQGIAMDDLSKAQRNMIASTLQMKETEIDQFFGEDMLMGMDDLTAATEEADLDASFDDMIKNANFTKKSMKELQEATQKNLLFNTVGPKRLEEVRRGMAGVNIQAKGIADNLNQAASEEVAAGFKDISNFIGGMADKEKVKAALKEMGIEDSIANEVDNGIMKGLLAASESENFSMTQFAANLAKGSEVAGNEMAKKTAQGFELYGEEFKKTGVYSDLTVAKSAPKAYQPFVESANIAGQFMGKALASGINESIVDLDLSEALPELSIPLKILPEVGEVVDSAAAQIANTQSLIDEKMSKQMEDIKTLLEEVRKVSTSVAKSVGKIPPKIEFTSNVMLNGQEIGRSMETYTNNMTGTSLDVTTVD